MGFLMDYLMPGLAIIFGVVVAFLGLKKRKAGAWGKLPTKSTPQFRQEELKRRDAEIDRVNEERKRQPFNIDASKDRLAESKKRREEWDADDS